MSKNSRSFPFYNHFIPLLVQSTWTMQFYTVFCRPLYWMKVWELVLASSSAVPLLAAVSYILQSLILQDHESMLYRGGFLLFDTAWECCLFRASLSSVPIQLERRPEVLSLLIFLHNLHPHAFEFQIFFNFKILAFFQFQVFCNLR